MILIWMERQLLSNALTTILSCVKIVTDRTSTMLLLSNLTALTEESLYLQDVRIVILKGSGTIPIFLRHL